MEDGAAIWRIARDSEVLDLNSSYSYLLWCRDFAATSLVARNADGEPIAFVTGYARPDRPQTLVVWQIAVDRSHRGQGLAGTLLDALTARVTADRGIRVLETTVTPDNTASDRLFTAYAERHGARLEREVLFAGHLFPEESGAPATAGEAQAPGKAGEPTTAEAPGKAGEPWAAEAPGKPAGSLDPGASGTPPPSGPSGTSGTSAPSGTPAAPGGTGTPADRGHPAGPAHQPEVLYRISPISV